MPIYADKVLIIHDYVGELLMGDSICILNRALSLNVSSACYIKWKFNDWEGGWWI